MPHNPPKTIEIGGVTIAIRIVPDLDAWVEYHSDEREIVLASRTLDKLSTMRETIRHEMFHAALDLSGLSYVTAKFSEMEEGVTRCVDNIFHPAWEKVRKQIELEN